MIAWLRTWWQAFRERWIAARNPFDVDTDFQESNPSTGWQEISAPGDLEPRREQVK